MLGDGGRSERESEKMKVSIGKDHVMHSAISRDWLPGYVVEYASLMSGHPDPYFNFSFKYKRYSLFIHFIFAAGKHFGCTV